MKTYKTNKTLIIFTIGFLFLTLMAYLYSQNQDNKVQPLFEDWTERVGLQNEKGNTGVLFADINNDYFPDIILDGGKFFLNEKGKHFKLINSPKALFADDKAKPPVPGHALILGDVNNDGNLDLFVTFTIDSNSEDFKKNNNYGRRNELWLGDGKGNFTLKKNTGISTEPATTITGMFFDYDGDNNLDLYLGNWWTHPWQSPEVMISPLYKGHGDGTFEDVTKKAGIEGNATPERRDSRRPIFCLTHTDWNNDGMQDMLIGTYSGKWNILWRNNGDGTFTDVAQETGFDCDTYGRWFAFGSPDSPYCNICCFSLPAADFNCDGNMDCFVSTIRHWDYRVLDPSMLLINLGEEGKWKFRRDFLSIGRPFAFDHIPTQQENYGGDNWGDVHADWIDVDNDGWQDLAIASSEYPDPQLFKLYHQKPDGSGQFEDWTERLGFRWVSAATISFADIDRDGAMDVLIARSHMRFDEALQKKYPLAVGVFHNLEAKRSGNGFFNLRLLGQAIGARITIWTDKHRQIREVYGAVGIGSQRNDSDCCFGLGKEKIIDKIEIRWPDKSNTIQIFENIEPNKFYTLVKGDTLNEVKFK
jgi:hypothetical protein